MKCQYDKEITVHLELSGKEADSLCTVLASAHHLSEEDMRVVKELKHMLEHIKRQL